MDKKLESIIIGVINLFKQYGLRSISMDEVARSLGISKKTLYQYVVNKEDLIMKCCEYIIETYRPANQESSVNHNAIDVLLEISMAVRTLVDDVSPVVIFDFQKYYPHVLRAVIVKKREMIFADMNRNFERGLKEGLYRAEIDHDLVLRLYIKNLIEIHDPEFINAPVKKVFNVMFDSHIRSIVNAKGLSYYEKKIKPQTTISDL